MSTLRSIDSVTGEVVWSGQTSSRDEIEAAVHRARQAFSQWSHVPITERESIVRGFALELNRQREKLAAAISAETGKPLWESLTEVQSMVGKAELSIEAFARRCGEFRGGPAVTRFRPHGVLAVLGPYNFPGHLPNGHILPALLAGNSVVFKPSEYTPWVAEIMADCWRAAGLPPGALAVVQGGREVGGVLAQHRGLDGLLFTGSSAAGRQLAEQFAATPQRLLALEMGGNNPLVVWAAAPTPAAALIVVQSAFLSAGQRCTCARRLILSSGTEGDALLRAVVSLLARVRVGHHRDRPEPFMGPVISAAVAQRLLAAQEQLFARGAREIVRMCSLRKDSGLLSPGLIDVTSVKERADEELFGPLLQVVRVPTFEAALAEANATRYGLAAGLVSDDPVLYQRFASSVRAGVVNWNQPLTGASGAAPFGGVGQSGNHRPSAFFAADYCSFPVASLERTNVELPLAMPMGLTGE